MTPFFLMFGREMNKFKSWSTDKDIDKLLALEKRTLEIKNHIEVNIPDTIEIISNKQVEQKIIQNSANNVLETPLKIDSTVYLKNEGLLSKLAPRYTGPYTIVKQTKGKNYTLKDSAGNILDKTYPVEKLKLQPDQSTDDIYAVERILGDRTFRRQQQYLVKWKNFPDSENSWENESNFVSMLPIKIYWDSKQLVVKPQLRNSRKTEKVNLIKHTNNTSIGAIHLYFFLIFILLTKSIHSTRIQHSFKFCDGTSNARLADYKSMCTYLDNPPNQLAVPWLPNNETFEFKIAILKKITHAVSGSGFQCSMEKLTIKTYTNLFYQQSEYVTTEPITISASDCWYMVHTKSCKDKRMSCDGSSCSYKAHIKTSYRWLESVLHEDYTCRTTPRIISAKTVNDNLFGSSVPFCRASDLFCIRQDHIIVWTQDVIHSCPFEVIKIETTFAKGNLFICLIDNLLFQAIDIEESCGEQIIRTTEGLYILRADKATSFRTSTSTDHDIQELAFADADYIKYKTFKHFSELQASFCYHAANTLQVFSKFENEYIEINDVKGNPIILYASNGQLYLPHCTRIEVIDILSNSSYCYKDVPIQFEYQNTTWNAFLQKENIIKRQSKLIHCQAINHILNINKQVEIRRNGSMNVVRSNTIQHFETLNLVEIQAQNYNFHHAQALIESHDLDDTNPYIQVPDDTGNFIITADNLNHDTNIIVKPVESLVDAAKIVAQTTKNTYIYIKHIIFIIFVSIICLIILTLIFFFRNDLKKCINLIYAHTRRPKLVSNGDFLNKIELKDRLFPNLQTLNDPTNTTTQQVTSVYNQPDDYQLSENTKNIAINIVKNL